MRMFKITLLISVILCMVILQPGCWDQREVERLGIVLATGVDMAPGGRISVIVQNTNPSAFVRGMAGGGVGGTGAGVTNKPYRNRSVEANTLFDAIRDMSRQTPRELFFAHNQVILVSERLARERGMQEIMDFFERNPQIRRTTWLLVVRGDLKALLDEPGRLEGNPAQRIFGIINERDLSSHYAVQRIGDFLELMESEGAHPFTAVIKRMHNPSEVREHRNRMHEGHVAEPHQVLEMDGTAVFRRDKMVGWLNSRESRGLLWVRGEVRDGIIDITDPEGKGGLVSLEIIRSKTKIDPEIKDGRIKMAVKVGIVTNLAETTGPLDLTKPETISRLEGLLEGAVRREIESAVNKAQQEYRVDVFGFGSELHREYPRQWKEMKNQWSALFPGVEVETAIEGKIRRTGMVTKPVEPKQK